jgi:tetratricopeptide (TPR) repeat protein
VATALCNRAVALRRLGRYEEAVAAGAEVAQRYGGAESPAACRHVSGELTEMAISFRALGRHDDAIADYDEALRRFGGVDVPGLAAPLALALRFKAEALRKVGRPWDAVAVEDEVIRRFGNRSEAAVRDSVDRARASRQRALGGRKRSHSP